MPLASSPSQDDFAHRLKMMESRLAALETQQNFGVRDGSGVLRAQGGLLPNGDYGFSVTDPLSHTFEVVPFQAALVTASQVTASATWTDLATVGPSVSCWIGASGSALVFVSAQITAISNAGYLGVSIDGGAVTYTSGAFSGSAQLDVGGFYQVVVITTKTSHTFKLQYETSGTSVTFANRSLLVWPF